jgi:hypothetical protein
VSTTNSEPLADVIYALDYPLGISNDCALPIVVVQYIMFTPAYQPAICIFWTTKQSLYSISIIGDSSIYMLILQWIFLLH